MNPNEFVKYNVKNEHYQPLGDLSYYDLVNLLYDVCYDDFYDKIRDRINNGILSVSGKYQVFTREKIIPTFTGEHKNIYKHFMVVLETIENGEIKQFQAVNNIFKSPQKEFKITSREFPKHLQLYIDRVEGYTTNKGRPPKPLVPRKKPNGVGRPPEIIITTKEPVEPKKIGRPPVEHTPQQALRTKLLK